MPTRNELNARVLSFAFQGDKLTGETFASGRSAMVGMGMVNVMAALGGFMGVNVEGGRAQTPGQSFTLQAIPIGDGPFTFEWRVDGNSTVVSTSPQPTFVIASGGVTRTYSVTVKETSTGIRKTVTVLVGTTPTHTRTLFGRDTIFSYASFLDGHRVNATLGADLAMPQQCTVSAVLGQEYRKNSSGQYVAFASPVSSRDSAGRGFSVTRPALWMSNQQPIPANALNIDVHAWHDGVSSIMVRPAYTVDEPNGFDCLTGDLQVAP